MNVRTTFLFLALLAAAWTTRAGQAELHANVAIDPAKPGVSNPAVRAETTDLKLTTLTAGRWTYVLSNPERAFGDVSLVLDGTPALYRSIPLRIRTPFETQAPLRVTIYAVQVEDTPAKVREIFAQPVQQLDSGELFNLYQQTAVLADKRVSELRERKLTVHDVRIFFKFLEVARELGWNSNLYPDELVRRVRAALRSLQDTARDRQVVETAIPRGNHDLQVLLAQIELIEAEQLRRIWIQIKQSDNPQRPSGDKEVCAKYAAFRYSLLHDVDPVLLRRWDAAPNYRFSELATAATTLCATREAEAARDDLGQVDNDAKSRIKEKYGPIDLRAAAIDRASPLGEAAIRHNSVLRALRVIE